MTKVQEHAVKCCRCGRASKQMVIYSVNFCLGNKNDNQHLMQHEQECPHCGYRASSISQPDNLTDKECLKLLEPEIERRMEELDLFMKDENGEFIFESNGERAWQMGACHTVWEIRKDLMLKRFERKWESPMDKNPDLLVD